MKRAGRIDLTKTLFTFDEVMHIIGMPIDIEAKYETKETDGAWINLDDNDSDELTGAKLEHYANQIGDMSVNFRIKEQQQRLSKLADEKGAIEWL